MGLFDGKECWGLILNALAGNGDGSDLGIAYGLDMQLTGSIKTYCFCFRKEKLDKHFDCLQYML